MSASNDPLAKSLSDIQGALTQIDSATTQAAAAQTTIQTRITNLMNQIANAPDLATAQALAIQAAAEAAKLQPIADALTQMGQDPANPVPTPVTDPLPPQTGP